MYNHYYKEDYEFLQPHNPRLQPGPFYRSSRSQLLPCDFNIRILPGVPIYHSHDLIKWKLIGHALTRPSQLQVHTSEPGGGVWATTIRYHCGVFYIIAGSFQRYRPQQDDRIWPQGFYVKTTDIWDDSSWSDPIYFDQVGFDQDVSSDPLQCV